MRLPVLLLHTLYVISVCGLALYGFQALWLTWHYLRRDRTEDASTVNGVRGLASTRVEGEWPSVAVHLPIYNERHVAERVMRASAGLAYPAGKLAIRVLDDSDDSTRGLVDRVAEELRAQGHDVHVVRRPSRTGYKAGALAYAMQDERPSSSPYSMRTSCRPGISCSTRFPPSLLPGTTTWASYRPGGAT